MLRRVAPFLVLLTACGPDRSPMDEDGATTGDTADPTESIPTTTNGPDTDDFPGLCAPCGTIREGELSPAGRTELDGILVAVDQLRDAVVTVQGEFRADIRAIAEIYDLAPADDSPAFIAQLITAIQADFAANLEAARVHHVPSRCSSNVDVAAAAQRQCEAGAGCEVVFADARPPALCEGRCEGDCEAVCSGDLSCVQPVVGSPCEGLCRGVCTFAVGAACAGICVGECSGECLVIDSQGDCHGPCNGACTGNCEFAAPAACTGVCTGACFVEQGSAQCLGDGGCRGACSGACAGECAGRVTPPSSSGDCPVTATCQAQASEQGNASLQCTPPVLDLQVVLNVNLDAASQAQFIERRRVLLQRSRTILQGAARLRALTDGVVDGEPLWDPPPQVQIAATIQGILESGVPDELGISESRLPCVIPALQEALVVLADTAASAAPTVQAQTDFAAFITGDF